jgi:hypothetical protein
MFDGPRRPRPFVPGLEVQSEPDVIHAQVAICIAHNGIRNDFRNLLRHDSDIELIAPDVAVSIQAYAVIEASHFNNVSLQANIRKVNVRLPVAV